MKLDVRFPTLVVTGTWNPAIFQPGWIAMHLFDIPEGEEVAAVEATSSDQPQRVVSYIHEVGVAATRQRIEVFANKFDEDTRTRAEALCQRVFEKLPHTPFGSFGVNFQFVEPDPSDELGDKLKTNDEIEHEFTVKEQKFLSIIEFDKNVDLNFSRSLSKENAIFSFNYHHSKIGTENSHELIIGATKKYLASSLEILGKQYNLEGYETLHHDFQEAPQSSGSMQNA